MELLLPVLEARTAVVRLVLLLSVLEARTAVVHMVVCAGGKDCCCTLGVAVVCAGGTCTCTLRVATICERNISVQTKPQPRYEYLSIVIQSAYNKYLTWNKSTANI